MVNVLDIVKDGNWFLVAKNKRNINTMNQDNQLPKNKQPALRVMPQPNDENSVHGDVFGGWLMAKMDLAGFAEAADIMQGPMATIAVNNLKLLHPVFVFNVVSIYADIVKIGKHSLTVQIEAYSQCLIKRVEEYYNKDVVKVGEAEFVYVAIEKPGKKRLIPVKK